LIPIGLNFAIPTLEAGASVSFNDAHAIFGHVGTEVIRKTNKFYGWKLTRKPSRCAYCTEAKAKQRSVSKTLNKKSTVPGERLFAM
jgi:hypothetical protein